MEKDIEKYLRLKVKKMGGLALKFVSPSFTGVPDRVVLLPNVAVFFVEVKNTGQKMRPRQEYVKKQFEKLGLEVYTVDSKEKIDEILTKKISRIYN